MSKLLIVLGSTRPGRIGLPVAQWFTDLAVADSRFQVELVDLAELGLPLLDEPDHPALRRYTTEHARAWSATVESADAVVLVTAEYNWGYPAPLKNALDYLCHEWANKPVGFVSYGGVAAGTRSVQQLRQVTSALRMVTAVNAVHIPVVFNRLDGDARLISDPEMQEAATTMLEELEALDQTLAPTRERLAG
jgi:NAD(P)H-dependent FMN reductase